VLDLDDLVDPDDLGSAAAAPAPRRDVTGT
jgi:hypothetical protein